MSSFPLQTVILPAVLVSSAVFSTLTLPFVLLKEPIAIDIPPLLSGGRIEPMFDAENKDVAIRYVGIAILLSVGAGIGTVELLRARHSAQELTQTKNQLSTLKLSLQEKSGQAGAPSLINLEDDADLSGEDNEADPFDDNLDGHETESLTLTFDQYVAAESLGQNLDAFPLMLSEQPTESIEEVDQATLSSLASLPLEETIQQDIREDEDTSQNGHELEPNLVDDTPFEGTQTDTEFIEPTDLNEVQPHVVQNNIHVADQFQSSYMLSLSVKAAQNADQDSERPAVQVLMSPEQYQTCRIRVPHLNRRLFAVLAQGKYHGLFRSRINREKALDIAAKLQYRGDQPIVTQIGEGYAVWVWQPEAVADEATA